MIKKKKLNLFYNRYYLLQKSFIQLNNIYVEYNKQNYFLFLMLNDLNLYYLFNNFNINNLFKSFLRLYLEVNYFYNFFFSKLFNKFCNINQRCGKKYLSFNILNKSFYLNKIYFNVENIILFYNVIYLFVISIRLDQKKKGKKLIIMPRVAHFSKVFKISIKMIFFVVKNSENIFFLNKLVSELYFIFKKEYVNSSIIAYYKKFLKTSIENQSWLSLK